MDSKLYHLAQKEEDKFTPLQQFMFYSYYSNLNKHNGNRETWAEAIDRVIDILGMLSKWQLSDETYESIYRNIATLDVLPSMRLFSQSKAYIEKNNLAIYNCSYLPITSTNDIADVLALSLSGCGVGYSTQYRHINQLPVVTTEVGISDVFVVPDTSEGWRGAFQLLLDNYFYKGLVTPFDVSLVREKGSLLRTKNGVASGPGPLLDLFEHTYYVLRKAQGRRLISVEVMDIADKIAECAISGALRRGALINLFDLDDNDMLTAKHRPDLFTNPRTLHWANSNNSAILLNKLPHNDIDSLLRDSVLSVYSEPGLFNLRSHIDTLPKRRKALWNDNELLDFGTQPCNEILLSPYGLCNLTTIVAKPNDTYEQLIEKQRISSIIGTIQSMADNFIDVNDKFRQHQIKERLLGCNITNVWGCKTVRNAEVLTDLKKCAVDTNAEYAKKLGINQSAAVTSVKPAGNTSALLGGGTLGGPGINPVHYKVGMIRNIKLPDYSSTAKALFAVNAPTVPHNYDTGYSLVRFPVEVADDVITAEDLTALDQLEMYRLFIENYTEHSVSISVQYDDDEITGIVDWVYTYQDVFKSVAFMKRFDTNFPYLPIEKSTKEAVVALQRLWPTDWVDNLRQYDIEKLVDAGCAGGACVIGPQ